MSMNLSFNTKPHLYIINNREEKENEKTSLKAYFILPSYGNRIN